MNLPAIPRQGLSEAEAATFIGIGITKFREMVKAGTMPKPRVIGTRRLFCVDELRIAFHELPIEGERESANSWADLGRDKA